MPNMTATDINSLLNGVQLKVDEDKMQTLMQNVLTGYITYAATDPTTDISSLPTAFETYLSSDSGKAVVKEQLMKIITSGSVTSISQDTMNNASQAIMTGFMQYALMNGLDITDTSKLGDYFQAYAATPAGSALVDEQMDLILTEALNNVKITDEQMSGFTTALITGYIAYAQQNALPDPTKISSSFTQYMNTPEAQALITTGAMDAINMDEIEAVIASNMNGLTAEMAAQMGGAMESVFAQVADVLGDNIQKAMEDTFSDSEDIFTIDEDAFAEAFQVNMDEKQMQSFLAEMMSTGVSSADKNLSDFGYCAEEDISSITIYPKDFESKDAIVAIINDYNAREKEAGNDGITYTDIVGALMKSVTRIVNTISYVLIAFVAISLVVSSIMIGVITYISVLERRKEIGILRAMGASKSNIAQVFNAETVITGFLAGSMGVGISLLLLIPANIIIHTIGETDAINAQLPPLAGIILILLSVVLTLIGGLIPSKTASKQDPVTALRTE
jgi:ABC-type antimicrobial peptide transport system permease subunit